MTVLVVVGHPDDEVLSCGGSAYRWSKRGERVVPCVLVGDAQARSRRPSDNELAADIETARLIIGFDEPILGSFPNIEINTVPHLELVQFIESAIEETEATTIVTHHPGDLNDDHRHVSLACQAAARIYQRRGSDTRIEKLLYAEVPSSTDWAPASNTLPFTPTAFVEISEAGLDAKLEALAAYRGVMRPYPHPRSEEVIRGLAAVRGSEAGLRHAEAFQVAFIDLSI